MAHRARGSISAGSNVSPLTGASETGGQSGDGSRERRDDALLIGVPHAAHATLCWMAAKASPRSVLA